MKNQQIVYAVALMCVLLFCSCSKDDGDWDEMKWELLTQGVAKDGKAYVISSDGGTLLFSCKNYNHPWLSHAQLDDGSYVVAGFVDESCLTLKGDWFEAKAEGEKLYVTFDPNTSGQPRSMTLEVTAGDIFYSFQFMQGSKQ